MYIAEFITQSGILVKRGELCLKFHCFMLKSHENEFKTIVVMTASSIFLG